MDSKSHIARLIAIWMGAIIGLLGIIATDIPIFRIRPNKTIGLSTYGGWIADYKIDIKCANFTKYIH